MPLKPDHWLPSPFPRKRNRAKEFKKTLLLATENHTATGGTRWSQWATTIGYWINRWFGRVEGRFFL